MVTRKRALESWKLLLLIVPMVMDIGNIWYCLSLLMAERHRYMSPLKSRVRVPLLSRNHLHLQIIWYGRQLLLVVIVKEKRCKMLLMEISLYTGIFVGMNLPWSLSIVPRQIRSFRRQRISLLIWCDTLTIMVMLKIMSQVLVKMERTGKVLLKVYLLTRCLFKLQYRKYLLLFAILNLLFRLKRMVGSGSW